MWTIETLDPDNDYAVLESKTAAEWGIENLQRSLMSQACDTLSFDMIVADAAADPVFAVGTILRVMRDGVGWFFGRVCADPRQFGGGDERLSYTVSGPWWWLEQCVYQQEWQTSSDGSSLARQYKSRVILGQNIDENTRLSTGQQIAAALTYAQSCGAPIQVGTSVPALTIMYTELKDVTCAQIVKNMLRWTPDAVTYFDYTTLPPTMHTVRRSQMTAVSQALFGGEVTAFQVEPLYNRKVSSVCIHYEKTFSSDSATWATLENDIAPAGATGRELGALVMTIDLAGSETTTESQKIKTKAIDVDSLTFWKAFVPELKDVTAANCAFSQTSKTADDGNNYDHYIVEGSQPNWKGNSSQVTCEAVATVTITTSGGTGVTREIPCKATMTGTRLSSGTYSRTTSFTEAEPTPSGVAAALYEALGTLEYGGTVQLTQADVGAAQWMGKTLNLTGGRTEWAGMNAVIQQVRENVEQGFTEIQFGAPDYLGPQDRVELLRASRHARGTYRAAERKDGKAKGKANVEGSDNSANNSGGSALGDYVVKGTNGVVVSIKASDIPVAAKDAKFRAETVYVNGNVAQAYYLRSESAS